VAQRAARQHPEDDRRSIGAFARKLRTSGLLAPTDRHWRNCLSTTPDTDFHEWIKRDPPPDLQALVTKYGSCSAIPAEAWADYDARCAAWQERRQARL
jgi:hypothetical protein